MRSGGTPQASRCAPTPSDVTKGTRCAGPARGWSGSQGGRSGRARSAPRRASGSCAQRAPAPAGSAWGPQPRRATRACPTPDRSARAGRRSRAAPWSGRARWRAGRLCAAAAARPRAGRPTAAARSARAASPPHRKSLSVGRGAAGSRRPGSDRVHVAKARRRAHSGEARMRSSRAPRARSPNDIIEVSPFQERSWSLGHVARHRSLSGRSSRQCAPRRAIGHAASAQARRFGGPGSQAKAAAPDASSAPMVASTAA